MTDVQQWLDSLGLGRYAKPFAVCRLPFAENDIDFRALHALTDGDLAELGLSLGHRRVIQQAIAQLDEQPLARHLEAVADKRTGATGAAEHRQLTVMFCDLVGSVELAERMDIEDYRELLSSFRSAVVEVVQHYDGFVARHQGDAVLIYFGYPQAHENDAERAVHAGLEVLRRIEALTNPYGVTTAVRIGVATGQAVVGDLLQAGGVGELAALGQTPNLAARLQGAASANELIVSATTIRLVGTLFETEATGPLDLKGFSEPVAAYRVRSQRRTPSRWESRAEANLTPLVGRGAELALLEDRWMKAKEGCGAPLRAGGAGPDCGALVRACGYLRRLRQPTRSATSLAASTRDPCASRGL